MDVERDARLLGGGPERGRAAGVADLGALVALRVAEEELHEGGPAGPASATGSVCSTWAPMAIVLEEVGMPATLRATADRGHG